MGRCGRIAEMHLGVEDIAHRTEVSALEGFHSGRVGLDHVASTDDLVVHGNHGTAVSGFLEAATTTALYKFFGPSADKPVEGNMAPTKTIGLRALGSQVNKIGRFFHRVRTVRDNETINLVAVFIDRLHELEPHIIGHNAALDCCTTCFGMTFATSAKAGTAATKWFTETLPAV